MIAVLDASAILALIFGEPGAAVVDAALNNAVVSAVNWSEPLVVLIRRDIALQDALTILASLQLRAIAFDGELAAAAAALYPITRHAGLSLGDRCCLALARSCSGYAFTSDRSWSTVADAAGIQVRLIR